MTDLFLRAKEIAADKLEPFGTEHLALAMDERIPGSAYNDGRPHPMTGVVVEEDSLDVKMEKLAKRWAEYISYDRILAEKGQTGNREIDAAIIRLAVWDGHKKQIFDWADEASDQIEHEQRKSTGILSLACKINGMFLGREILNRDFTFFTHAPAFDLFVQKNPYKSIPQQDPEHKIRLLQMPRGSFKSTVDGVDCVQWIIVNPDIRIVFLTATLDLAKDFVKEVKNYFMFDPESGREFTPFQHIFARDIRLERPKNKEGEYEWLNFLVEEGKEGKETRFVCPARTRGDQKKKDVTIWAGSVGAGKVGKHCDVSKADDAVDEKNTDTAKLIAKTKKRIGMAMKLVDPGGYKDNLGTPYAPNDWYNHIRQNVKNVLTLVRPAKWLKKDINGATAFERGVPEKEFTRNDWSLLFPLDKHGTPKLTHEALQEFEEEDPEGFPSQYMLNPRGFKKVSFTEALIYQQTITPDRMPSQTEKLACYILWDLADTQNLTSDYSVGIVMLVDRENRAYVVEIIRDRFTYSEICYQVAKSNHDYKPLQIIIEDARGASKLKGEMIRASQDMGDKLLPLNFVKVSNVKEAKALRVGKLEPRLKNRTLWFLNTINCYADLVAEFKDFGSAPHDDIPDAIGLSEHVLPEMRTTPIDPVAAAAAQRILDDKEFFEMIHSSPEPAIVDVPVEPLVLETPDEDLWDPYGAVPFRK